VPDLRPELEVMGPRQGGSPLDLISTRGGVIIRDSNSIELSIESALIMGEGMMKSLAG